MKNLCLQYVSRNRASTNTSVNIGDFRLFHLLHRKVNPLPSRFRYVPHRHLGEGCAGYESMDSGSTQSWVCGYEFVDRGVICSS